MTDQPAPGGVGKVLDAKARASRRLTPWSIPWVVLLVIAAVLALPYEIYCVATHREGGPLTHVVKFIYGEQGSTRWWLLGWPNTGVLLWLAPHFLFDGVGLRTLIVLVCLGLAVGAAGYLITR